MLNKAPQIALIGPPNAGKSTLFNILVGSRSSLVKDLPGVTRDILTGEAQWWGQKFTVADTGGLDFTKESFFSKHIKEQILSILKNVEGFIVIFDGKNSISPQNKVLLNFVKKFNKPFYTVINKVDSLNHEHDQLNEFYSLGEDINSASFENHRGVPEIIEWILKTIPEEEILEKKEEAPPFKLAVLGKPNTGKSSFCNHILGYKRMIVSEKPGTTVDPVKEIFEFHGNSYELIDTAGLRKQAKRRKEHLELLSAIQSEKIIEKSDMILYFIDGLLGPSVQDAKTIEKILENHKPVVIVGNKSDLARPLIENYALNFKHKTSRTLHFIEPKDLLIHLISAKTGEGIDKMFRKIEEVKSKLYTKIKTSVVNEALNESFKRLPTPTYRNKNIRLSYATQTRQIPPSFLVFGNYPEGLQKSQKRFLTKQLKKRFSLYGVPLRLFFIKNTKKSIKNDHLS